MQTQFLARGKALSVAGHACDAYPFDRVLRIQPEKGGFRHRNFRCVGEDADIAEGDVVNSTVQTVLGEQPGSVNGQAEQERMPHRCVRRIRRVHVVLKHIRQLVLGVLNPDILKCDLSDVRTVVVLDVEESRGAVDAVAVAEEDVPEGRRVCLGAQFQIAPPVAPDHTALYQNVGVICRVPAHDALDYHAIVEVAQEAVPDAYIAAVEQVNAVRIVAPHSDCLEVFQRDVLASCRDDRKGGGVAQGGTLHPDVAATVKAQDAVQHVPLLQPAQDVLPIGGQRGGVIVEQQAAFVGTHLAAPVDDTVAEYVDVLRAHCPETAVQVCVPVD